MIHFKQDACNPSGMYGVERETDAEEATGSIQNSEPTTRNTNESDFSTFDIVKATQVSNKKLLQIFICDVFKVTKMKYSTIFVLIKFLLQFQNSDVQNEYNVTL